MNKTLKHSLLYTFILLMTALVLTATGVYAWYTSVMRIRTSDATDGHANIGIRINLLFERLRPGDFSGTITYPDGTTVTFDNSESWGTAANPYIISLPRHMINLYALQESGYFYDRYISQNYDGNGDYKEDSNVKPYFLVCETDGTPACVDGVRAGESIKIKPVGNDEYPFIGAIGGAQAEGVATAPNGKTSISSIIANFTVEAPADATDIGLFGKIGYLGEEPENASEGDTFNGAISGVSDLLLYDVKIVSAASGERDESHLWESDASPNVRYEEDHHVGILAGHIEYAAIQNISVYYSSDSVTAIDVDASGANYLSDSGIIGLVYNLNPATSGNSIGCATGTTIAGTAKGAGNEWGASIDMKTMYDRLSAAYDQADQTSIEYATSQTTTVVKDINGQTVSSETVVNDTELRNVYYISTTDAAGSYTFVKHTNGTKQYLYLYGDDSFSTNYGTNWNVTRAYIEEYNGNYYITDGNGNYLRYNNGITNTTSRSNAAAFTYTSEHYLRYTSNTSYYLRNNAGTLQLNNSTTNSNTNTRYWSATDHSITSGKYFIAYYNNSWRLLEDTAGKTQTTITYEDKHAYIISDGNGNYLQALTNGVQNTAASGDATKWVYENNKLATQFGTGETPYYLYNNNGTLTVSTTNSTNWTNSNGYFTDGNYYIIYYNGAWVLSPSYTYYTIQNGNSAYQVTIGGNTYGDWFFAADGTLSVLVNGTPYYLYNNNGALATTTTRANASSWTVTNNRISTGGLYLSVLNGTWQLTPSAQLYKFYTANGEYLHLNNNGSLDYVTTAGDATGWIVANPGGSGRITTSLNGSTYSLYNNSGTLNASTTNSTNWTVGNDTLSTGSSYVLLKNGTWTVYTPGNYRVISDGNGNYLRYGGTGNNTTDEAQATDWVFSAATGNNITITTVVNGQTYYLRRTGNNSTTLQISTTNSYNTWTVESNGRIHNGNYYLTCNNGTWGITQAQSYILISSGDNYLNATSTGVTNVTNADDATLWAFSETRTNRNTTISASVGGVTRYLYVNYSNNRYTLTTNTSSQNWQRNSTTSGYLRSSSYTSNYVWFSNGNWTLGSNNNLTFTSVTAARYSNLTIESRVYDTTVNHDVVNYDLDVTHASSSLTGTADYTSVVAWKTVTTTSEASNYETNATYFPLVVLEDGSTNPKNTGYVISGNSLGNQGVEDHANGAANTTGNAKGDIRVSYYAKSGNISNSLSSNGNLNDAAIYTYNASGRQTISQVGVANLVKYTEAKADFQETLNSSTNVYGLHFMNAPISASNVVTVPLAVINDEEYPNYTMPKDCIDFRLRTKGYINFFAGTYFTDNSTFFSLHQINRDNDGNITSIKEISKIYGVPGDEKKAYIYQFAGESAPTLPSGYEQIFDMAWVTNPSRNWTDNAIYYYEIPVNGGEYALGSVSGKDGAYLMYLDIGTSAASHSSMLGTIDFVYDNSARGGNKIVVVPDTSLTDSSLDYYKPSLAIMYTDNIADNNTAEIGTFTVKVTRTIPNASAQDQTPTLTATFGEAEAEYLDVVAQHSGGDTIVKVYPS